MAKPLYSVHPGVLTTRKRVAELRSKSGRSLDEWLALMETAGPADEAGRREWLKSEHRLGTNPARWIAERSPGKGLDAADPDRRLAPDVKACPCQTIVPLYRKHVFAQIKPTTNTRIDMGFAPGGRNAEGRLIDTGGFAKKDRITHRIPISSAADIDDEVQRWLRLAYEEDV